MVFEIEELPPRVAVMTMLNASWGSHAVRAMAELGLADLLAGGPRSIDELAEPIDAHQQTLSRLFRALAAIGMCATDDDGRVV